MYCRTYLWAFFTFKFSCKNKAFSINRLIVSRSRGWAWVWPINVHPNSFRSLFLPPLAPSLCAKKAGAQAISQRLVCRCVFERGWDSLWPVDICARRLLKLSDAISAANWSENTTYGWRNKILTREICECSLSEPGRPEVWIWIEFVLLRCGSFFFCYNNPQCGQTQCCTWE